MIWSSEYLARLELDAEKEISKLVPCILDRLSISTEINVSEYQLPEYVQDIARVFWQGIRLDPISSFDLGDWGYSREIVGDGAFEPTAFTSAFETGSGITLEHSLGTVAGGKPTHYWYSKFGENVIRILPAANEVLLSYSNENGVLWNEHIASTLIVEYYHVADGVNFKIPDYIRRRTIKAYMLMKAFQKEGNGQNLKAAKYWKMKYQASITKATIIIDNISKTLLRYRESEPYMERTRPARPVLPPNWQTVRVSEDEW